MLSPEQRAALTEFIAKSKAESERSLTFWQKRMAAIENSEKHPDDIQKQTSAIEQCLKYGETEKQVLELAKSALTNELGLAEQVRALREALEGMPHSSLACMQAGCFRNAETGKADINAGHDPSCHWHKKTAALALAIPEATRQAAENAEKAGLLEELIAAIRQGQDKGSDESDIAHSIAKAEGIIAKAEALRAPKEQPASRFDTMRNSKGETMEDVARRWDAENRASKEAGNE